MIGHGYRDLRDCGRLAALVTGDADEFPVQPGQAGGVIGRWFPAGPLGLIICRGCAHAEEPQVDVVLRHGPVHLPHGHEVGRGGRPDLDRGTVREQRVRTASRLSGIHRASQGWSADQPAARSSPGPGTNDPAEGAEGRWSVTGPPEILISDERGPRCQSGWESTVSGGLAGRSCGASWTETTWMWWPSMTWPMPGRWPTCWSSIPPMAGWARACVTALTRSPWAAGTSRCCPPGTRPPSTGLRWA